MVYPNSSMVFCKENPSINGGFGGFPISIHFVPIEFRIPTIDCPIFFKSQPNCVYPLMNLIMYGNKLVGNSISIHLFAYVPRPKPAPADKCSPLNLLGNCHHSTLNLARHSWLLPHLHPDLNPNLTVLLS